MPVEHFKSRAAYRRNLAYRHINHIPMTAATVCIKGSCHKVKHSKNPERVKIDAVQKRKVARRGRGKHGQRKRVGGKRG